MSTGVDPYKAMHIVQNVRSLEYDRVKMTILQCLSLQSKA